MGVFFRAQSGPLIDDFEFDADTNDEKIFKDRLTEAFHQRAYNCWIAAVLYIGLLVFAGSQFLLNQKNATGVNSYSSPFPGLLSDTNNEENGVHQQYGTQYQDTPMDS